MSLSTEETNIQQLIDDHLQPVLSEEEEDRCNKCESLLFRKEIVKDSPNVLFIQIKKYFYNKKSNVSGKLSNPVNPDITIIFNDSTYKIKAIIQHHGQNLYSGHYTTMLYIDSKWVKCDDLTIKQNIQPINSDGYIYVYELYDQAETLTTPLQPTNDALNMPNIIQSGEASNVAYLDKKYQLRAETNKKVIDQSSSNKTHISINAKIASQQRVENYMNSPQSPNSSQQLNENIMNSSNSLHLSQLTNENTMDSSMTQNHYKDFDISKYHKKTLCQT